MISNNCNNFLVNEGIPQKNGRHTSHHARTHYAHDAMCHPFFQGIPPGTEKLLQSFLKYPRNRIWGHLVFCIACEA